MDVVDLREFYRSRLGNTTRRLICEELRDPLKTAPGQTVIGLGYAIPYLAEAGGGDARVLSFMLARQGVMRWPADGPVRSALVDGLDLPLLESMVDVALLVHALELSDDPLDMLQEVWRVLAPQGRLVLVVPNRRGVWSSSDRSPFGQGQPFSKSQVGGLLRAAQFSPVRWREALFMPPLDWSPVLSAAPFLEASGRLALGRFSGVIIVEAIKQVYAFSPGKRVRRILPRLKPALLPSPAGRAGATSP
jgi:SAM-dependent methyltransferase